MSLLISLCMLAAGPIDHFTHEVESASVKIFEGRGATPEANDVFVIDGDKLRWFSGDAINTMNTIELPPDIVAIDIADADGEPGREVIVMSLTAVTIESIDSPSDRRVVAEFDPPYEQVRALSTAPLVVEVEGKPAITIYRRDHVAFVRADGEVVDSSPLIDQDGDSMGGDLTIHSLGQTEIHVEARQTLRIQSSNSDQAAGSRAVDAWPVNLAHLYYAVVDRASESPRAYFDPDLTSGRTDVTLARRGPNASPLVAARFRGWPVRGMGLEDFTGDKMGDLLLWSTREPGTSVSAITRAAAARTWPVTIAIYPYGATTGRFAPQPMSRATVELPIAWFVSLERGSPLRLAATPDLDNDGKADFGFARSEDSYGIWLSSERDVMLGPLHTLAIAPPLRQAWTYQRADGNDVLMLHCADTIHIIQFAGPRPASP